jgi:hypothetical protein
MPKRIISWLDKEDPDLEEGHQTQLFGNMSDQEAEKRMNELLARGMEDIELYENIPTKHTKAKIEIIKK